MAVLNLFEYLDFFAAFYGNPPDARRISLGIVDKFPVWRFNRFKSAPGFCNLHGRASLCRHLPDLVLATPDGTKIDPSAVSRPARTHIIGRSCGYAARQTAIGANNENIPIASLGTVQGNP